MTVGLFLFNYSFTSPMVKHVGPYYNPMKLLEGEIHHISILSLSLSLVLVMKSVAFFSSQFSS